MSERKRTGRSRVGAWILGAVFAVTLVAGCLDTGGPKNARNEPPKAVLQVDRTVANSGDEFEFNGTGSHDPDGNLTLLRFDFGDGTRQEVHRAELADVRHAYAHPGEYRVVLTVLDDGGQGSESLTDSDTVTIAANDLHRIEAEVVKAGVPVGNTTRNASEPFSAKTGADGYVLNATARSLLAAGSSEVRVRILRSDGSEMANRTVSVPAGQDVPIRMDGLLLETGNYTLDIQPVSGGARVAGDLIVDYGKDVSPSSSSSSTPGTPKP